MATITADSLLDEAEFLSELERLEDGMPLKRQLTKPVDDVPVKPPATLPVEMLASDEPARPAGVSRAVTFAFVLLMGAAGAAGAALVFHERVAQLLSRIQ